MSNEFRAEIPLERWVAILKYRGMDTEALVVAQKRNLQTLIEASDLVARGMEELANRQASMVRNQLTRAVDVIPTLGDHKSLNDIAQQHLDYSRSTVEAALSGFQELSEMVWKTNRDAFDLVNRSVMDGFQNFLRSVPGDNANERGLIINGFAREEKQNKQ